MQLEIKTHRGNLYKGVGGEKGVGGKVAALQEEAEEGFLSPASGLWTCIPLRHQSSVDGLITTKGQILSHRKSPNKQNIHETPVTQQKDYFNLT